LRQRGRDEARRNESHDVFGLDLSEFGFPTTGIVFSRDVESVSTTIHADMNGQLSSLLNNVPREGGVRVVHLMATCGVAPV